MTAFTWISRLVFALLAAASCCTGVAVAQVSEPGVSDLCFEARTRWSLRTPRMSAFGPAHRFRTEAIASGRLVLGFTLPAESGGRVVQSLTIQMDGRRTSCALLAASVHPSDRDKLILWRIPEYGTPEGLISERFGHGQDLSQTTDPLGRQTFWISDGRGLGSRRFRMRPGGLFAYRAAALTDRVAVRLFSEPVTVHTGAISFDGRMLLSIGKQTGKAISVHLHDAPVPAGLDRTIDIRDRFTRSWPLSSIQRKKGHYRQGLAAFEDVVFVLSGNSRIDEPKWLFAYDLEGRVLGQREVRVGREMAISDGEGRAYEPESLEIAIIDGTAHLLIGIASGDVGARQFRWWAVAVEDL